KVLLADRPLTGLDGRLQAEFSIAELDDLAQAWSGWYLDLGVRPRDRVAVYLDDSFEDQLHLAALSRIGAIAVLVNGRMPVDTALGLIRRTAPVGLYTDRAHLAELAGRQAGAGVAWTRTAEDATGLTHRPLPDAACYRHAPDDPVLICHSSGTTGDPKPVVHTHAQSVAGLRARLAERAEAPDVRILSAAPQSHAGATAFTLYCLLAGVPLIALSRPGGPEVAAAVARYRPTLVLAFNQTHAALATTELREEDFASVRYWINMGDAAHDRHVRTLMRLGYHLADGERRPGSFFGDGLGSSELGWNALGRVFTPDSPPRPRHLGRVVPPARVAVLRPDGSEAGPDEVGMLGVDSPAVTPGYWNDSDTTYRSRIGTWFLSGDLVRRDAEGDFFHVDRVVDAIHTADGLLARAGKALRAAGQPELALLECAAEQDLPVGATGKVLKRVLRERYADLAGLPALPGRAFAAAAPASAPHPAS
ncbi:class I adenylate-forming enzyme family protein, partial [Kitasatospora sp. MBT63]|uniref:class I adenylate-forming enzyme family protein n=1 Tax=Kitasatospora sp. MBT63 TaxID=1444768 RepID=UPI001E311A71